SRALAVLSGSLTEIEFDMAGLPNLKYVPIRLSRLCGLWRARRRRIRSGHDHRRSAGVTIRIPRAFLPKNLPKSLTSPVTRCVAAAARAAFRIGWSFSGRPRPGSREAVDSG